MLTAVLAGWLLRREDREAGFRALPRLGPSPAFGWTAVIRFVTPALVALVLLWQLGLLPLA